VAEFEATAATLGGTLAETPPPHLKGEIMSVIATTRQERPRPRTEAGPVAPVVPLRRRWQDRVMLPAAAVLAILVVGLAVVVGNLNRRIDELETASTGVADVVAAADLQTWQVDGPGGSTARVVYSPTRGEGWFVADGMSEAPSGSVYELWLIDDSGATPAGLFDATNGGRVAHPITGDISSVAAIGVTVEPDGGSPQPTSDPIMVVNL
jgi:anti-sigma-K factor RskA